jgi:hypothetical protein
MARIPGRVKPGRHLIAYILSLEGLCFLKYVMEKLHDSSREDAGRPGSAALRKPQPIFSQKCIILVKW